MILFGLNKEQYLEKMKEDSRSRYKFNHPDEDDCGFLAPSWIDDWGDKCGEEKCCRAVGHDGEHMASDGANGWHYWEE